MNDLAEWGQIASTRFIPEASSVVTEVILGVSTKDPSVLITIQNLNDGTRRQIRAGRLARGAGGIELSPLHGWITFVRSPKAHVGLPTDDNELVAIRLKDGYERAVQRVTRPITLQGAASEVIGVVRVVSGTPARWALWDLETNRFEDKGSAAKLCLDASQNCVAWTEEGTLYALNLRMNIERRWILDEASDLLEMSWSSDGHSLGGILSRNNNIESRGKARPPDLEAFLEYDIWESNQCTVATLDQKIALPGAQLRIEKDDGLRFSVVPRDCDRSMFITVTSVKPPRKTDESTVRVWRSEDQRLPDERRAPSSSVLFWDAATRALRTIAEPGERLAGFPQHGRHALVYRDSSVTWMNAHQGLRVAENRDYFLIDLDSATTTSIATSLPVTISAGLSLAPRLSPNEEAVIYQDKQGDYVTYDLKTKQTRSVTRGLPTRFYWPENDPKDKWRPRDAEVASVLQGFSSDGKSMLLSDYYDVWSIPLDGSVATNLTKDGRAKAIRYERMLLDGEPIGLVPDKSCCVDLEAPIEFRAVDLNTGRTAVATYTKQIGLKIAVWKNLSIAAGFKDQRLGRFLFRGDAAGDEWYAVDQDWEKEIRTTDANPQRRRLDWIPEPRLIHYTTIRGQKLRAVLYLPPTNKGKPPYPAIISIYLKQTAYPAPFGPLTINLHDPIGPFGWLMRGYAVLLPDIQPVFNEAAEVALESVNAAVDAATATGFIDEQRLGIVGYSYGAYEALYIGTRSQRFKAVFGLAGVSDLWSDYGAMYHERPKAVIAESNQPFMKGPWWDNWKSMIEGSPLYHVTSIETPLLMAHGTEDKSIAFGQALEMFNSARRAGKRNVVLLEYRGQGHSFDEASIADMNTRVTEFFDFTVRGRTAPEWFVADESRSN
ncbi:MAG: acylaminoacyl-peptidase [Verrucomicrobia bacterium]|nr:acylaminoacyl-peptidase [Verrucomicrobiota bacterium]